MAAPEDGTEIGNQLHLVIIGAGLAGLAAAISTRLEGHRVTVLEKVPELEVIGAGLQITPNATRLFHHWGIFDELSTKAATPSYLAVRRYDGTQILACDNQFQEHIQRRYGTPFWDLHRADLQLALRRRAELLGITIQLGAEVMRIDPHEGIVTTKSHGTFQGDIILAADGLWSRSRNTLSERQVNPQPTGDLAYRIILNIDSIEDPELKTWLAQPSVNFWIGPHSHVVGYSVRKGHIYNLVLLTPDDLPEHVSRAAASVDEMRQLFSDWDPILGKLLAHVDQADKWRLMHLEPLDTWTNKEGSFLIAGDACHPMLPYLAQGANSSLEDGAVLGRLLRYVKSHEQLAPAVTMYEKLRKARGEAIAQESMKQASQVHSSFLDHLSSDLKKCLQREAFHMVDGPHQAQRDAVFLSALGKDELPSPFPSRWTCPSVQPWLYGYDAVAEADAAYSACPF